MSGTIALREPAPARRVDDDIPAWGGHGEFMAPAVSESTGLPRTPGPAVAGDDGRDALSAADEWAADDQVLEWDEGWLGGLHRDRVADSDNDLIICVAAAAISSGSGVGKTTLGTRIARNCDLSDRGFVAETNATLKATEFAREILADPDRVPNQSAVVFEEATGTLEDDGADRRRSMKHSVMNITKALATLRYRQITAVIIAQSTNWLDDRMRDVIDALVLINERGRATVYHPFRNDLNPSKKYNERKETIVWDSLPKNDKDYRHLEKLKAQSTRKDLEEEVDTLSLSREQSIHVGKKLRSRGVKVETVAETLGYSTGWVSNNCSEAAADG